MSTPLQSQPPEQENDWFFDIIINFLRSPRWKTPIMSFLDENCLIFDNEDENKLEYTSIHNEFQKIVDDLLSELMSELGVTQDQFLDACDKAAANPLHKKIVDQITAVDNFFAFKKLMVKRNTELNEQAIQMMSKPPQEAKPQTQQPLKQQKTASHPQQQTPQQLQSLEANAAEMTEEEKKAEEAMIKRALEISMQIENQKKQEYDEEEEMIKRVMEMSEREEKERVEKARHQDDQLKEAQRQSEILKLQQEKEVQDAKLKQQQAIIEQQQLLIQQQQQQQQHQQQQQQQPEEIKQQEPQQQMPKAVKKLKKQIPKKEQKPVVEQEEVKQLKKEKAPVAGFNQYDLPPVAMKRGGGGFDFDNGILIDQQKNIAKMNAMREFDDMEEERNKKPTEENGKSLKDMLKEKRENTEKVIEGQATGKPQQESMEERKKRLQAQRDILLKQKQEKRDKELGEFKEKTSNKEDLHKELLQMDNKVKAKQQSKQFSQLHSESLNLDDPIENDSPEVDKRLQIYKNMRNEIMKEESKTKEQYQKGKMDELDAKIAKLEKMKKEKDEKQRQLDDAERQKLQQKAQGNKNFLDNIKAFSVEDI